MVNEHVDPVFRDLLDMVICASCKEGKCEDCYGECDCKPNHTH